MAKSFVSLEMFARRLAKTEECCGPCPAWNRVFDMHLSSVARMDVVLVYSPHVGSDRILYAKYCSRTTSPLTDGPQGYRFRGYTRFGIWRDHQFNSRSSKRRQRLVLCMRHRLRSTQYVPWALLRLSYAAFSLQISLRVDIVRKASNNSIFLF